MMDMYKVGDLVKFMLEDKDIYSYDVPKMGTIGVIERQIYSFGLEQMLGVQVPMSVVQWADGQMIAVFCHDLSKVEISDEKYQDIVLKIRSIKPYTGLNIN